MRAGVLILTQGSNLKRFEGRKGDLFDLAFIDAVRTLDGPGAQVRVLIPWVADLAALISAATLDTASSFDPERTEGPGGTRTRLVPYLPPGEIQADVDTDTDGVFWRASHLSLAGFERPQSLEQALGAFPNIHVVMLGSPRRPATVRKALRGRELLNVFTFGSLLSQFETAKIVGVEQSRVVNLENNMPEISEGDDPAESSEFATERSSEEQLERYVPFGLLLQKAFEGMWPDDEDTG